MDKAIEGVKFFFVPDFSKFLKDTFIAEDDLHQLEVDIKYSGYISYSNFEQKVYDLFMDGDKNEVDQKDTPVASIFLRSRNPLWLRYTN